MAIMVLPALAQVENLCHHLHANRSKRCSREVAYCGILAVVGAFQANHPATPKNYSAILAKLQFPEGVGLRGRHRSAAREDRPSASAAFFNRLIFLHILTRNFIMH